MNKEYPPVALVEVWLYLITSNEANLIHGKNRAQSAINKHFGSFAVAEIYVEGCRCETEQLKYA